MKSLLFVAGLAGVLLVAACRKPDAVDCGPLPTATSTSTLAGFSQRNGAAVQTFALTLGAGAGTQTITTRSGAVLDLPAGGFVLPSGAAATGAAQVRIREIYTVPEMVLANRPTNQPGQGAMLVSGGEFNIQVYSGTQRLRLATGSLTLRSPIPTGQDTTRQLVWNQPATLASTATTPDTTGWLRANAAAVQQQAGRYQAFIPLDSIGWWNIDQYWHLYQNTPYARVQVNTPANTLTETRVYLRPIDFNGLARLYPTSGSGTAWTRAMPTGSTHLAVVLQLLNGQLYYGTQRFTVQAGGSTLTPVLQPVSEADAVQLIRTL